MPTTSRRLTTAQTMESCRKSLLRISKDTPRRIEQFERVCKRATANELVELVNSMEERLGERLEDRINKQIADAITKISQKLDEKEVEVSEDEEESQGAINLVQKENKRLREKMEEERKRLEEERKQFREVYFTLRKKMKCFLEVIVNLYGNDTGGNYNKQYIETIRDTIESWA